MFIPRAILPVRFSAEGYSGEYLTGHADLMLPLSISCAHNFYLDPVVGYGRDSQGYTDLGIGYRWLENTTILGTYVFGGYSRIENNARIWVINPGVEALGRRWDTHLNAYIIRGDRSKPLEDTLAFDHFEGHSASFSLFQVSQYAGNGADTKFGYQLFCGIPLKAYIGSYFFAPGKASNIWGGAAGLEYWVTHNVKVIAGYTYDNLRHSTGAVGLGVELGGTNRHCPTPCIEERMTDPVERYLSGLGHGSAIPVRTAMQPAAVGQVIPPGMRDDIAFFSQTGQPNNGGQDLTAENCTFENPCGPTDMTNESTTTLNTLAPNTIFNFDGGTYSAVDVPGGANPITIREGQSVVCTTPSTFEGGFILEGDNSITGATIEPTVNTAMGPGVTVLGGDNSIDGTQIGSSGNPFMVGVDSTGNSQTSLNDSSVFALSTGIENQDASNFSVEGSTVNVAGGSNAAIGVDSSGGSFSMNDSSINVGGGDDSWGIYHTSDSDLTLSGDTIDVSGGNGSFGVYDTGNGSVEFDGSSVNVDGGDNSFAFATAGSGPVTSSDSDFEVIGGANSVGYADFGSGSVDFNGGSITVDGADQSYGFATDSGSTGDVTLNGTQIDVTGGPHIDGIYEEGSGDIDLIGDTVTVNAPGETEVHGIHTYPGSTGDLVVDGSQVNVTGGDNAEGIIIEGDGNTDLSNGSAINVSGGNSTYGLDTKGIGETTVDGSDITVAGGSGSIAYPVFGSGPVTIDDGSTLTLNAPGQSTVGGLATAPTSSSAVTLNGTQINVTGGQDSEGISLQGSGDISSTGDVVTVNAPGGQAYGVDTYSGSTGNLALDGSQVNVNGGDGAEGILTYGDGDVDLNSSEVNVSGGNNSFGMDTEGPGAATISDSAINLASGSTSAGYLVSGSGPVNIGDSTITVDSPGQTVISGLATTESSTSNVTLDSTIINVTAGSTSYGIDVAGSGNISSTGDTITINAPGATDIHGIRMTAISTGNVALDSTQVNVSAGDSSEGITVLGAGDVALIDFSAINITGGQFTYGVDTQGSGAVTISASDLAVTGGAESVGVVVLGSGPILIENGSTITLDASGHTFGGVATAAGSPSDVTVSGTQINVTAGDGSDAVNINGSGNINLTGNVINNLSGESFGNGLQVGPNASSSITLTGNQINNLDNTGNGSSYGIYAGGNGAALDLADANIINITGAGQIIGISSFNDMVLTGSNINIGVTGSDQAVGLFTFDSGTITLDSASINVSGDGTSGISFENGGPIQLTNSNCMLNGNPVSCS